MQTEDGDVPRCVLRNIKLGYRDPKVVALRADKQDDASAADFCAKGLLKRYQTQSEAEHNARLFREVSDLYVQVFQAGNPGWRERYSAD